MALVGGKIQIRTIYHLHLKHKTKYRHTEYLFSMAEQQTLQLIYTLFLYKNYEQTYSAS